MREPKIPLSSFEPTSPADLAGLRLLDVRRAAAFDKATSMIPGAEWRDPARVTEWSRELSQQQPIVVYCVHGHEVSQGTAERLRAAGLDARYLVGGIRGWEAAGHPVTAKQPS